MDILVCIYTDKNFHILAENSDENMFEKKLVRFLRHLSMVHKTHASLSLPFIKRKTCVTSVTSVTNLPQPK